MGEQRNVIIAIVLSLVIILGWQWYENKISPPPPPPPPAAAAQPATPAQAPTGAISPPGTPGSGPAAPAPSAQAAAAPAARILIDTPTLNGSFSLRGARLDDLTLSKYRETTDPSSKPIELLNPAAGDGAYFVESGWASGDSQIALPNKDTLWVANGAKLTPDTPVTLTWDNGQGLRFTRTIAVDSGYMFTIADKVENSGTKTVSLAPYALVSRWGTPETQNYYVQHEGPLGVLDGTLKEEKYKSLKSDDHLLTYKSKGGWIGFTDKYWLTALVPDQSMDVDARMVWHDEGGLDRYQTDWTGPVETIAAGASATTSSHVFAGAKELALLDQYDQNLGIPKFDLAIDFGWFWFLTIPFFKFLRFIHAHVANFGIAIMIFTICIRGAFFPIASRSFASMNKMKRLQPEVKKLQERYKDDRAKVNQEMMALYKREKVNPVSGCLPILLQVPVFFALYKVLFVTIEMRHAPFFGWIKDLSVPDPTNIFNLFGLIPWDPTTLTASLHIGIWPLIMGVTLWAQQKLNPAPTDPTQAKIMQFLPIIFTFMLAKFPAGLVIYWAWSNTLSIAQQWVIAKRMARKS
jgi:YidC/Oxa1 family membrane protein insertase